MTKCTRVVLAMSWLLVCVPMLALAAGVATTAEQPTVRIPDDPPENGNAIAAFGDNCIAALVGATIVTDAQLATPGFLDGFDALIVTRDDSQFGAGLSAAAASQVVAYATGGNVALFPGDWADMVRTANCLGGDPPDATVVRAIINAVNFAKLSGHGYVGEFNGAAMAVTTNAEGFSPLGLIAGAAGVLGGFDNGVDTVTVFAPNHPVTASLPGVFSPVETSTFRTAISGVPGENVLARWADGAPAIIATSCEQGICQCVAKLQLASDRVRAGERLSYRVRLTHWRPAVVERSFSIRVVDGAGAVVAHDQTSPHVFQPGEQINLARELELPLTLRPGRYVFEVSVSGMTQGRAYASASFIVLP